MAVLLGIDTGGTFTDAVLVREAADGGTVVLATAKSPTTHGDLEIGVEEALRSVVNDAPDIEPGDISLVSLSTTLATNALVEGHGEPIGLIAAGFGSGDLDRAGIASVVDAAHLITVPGGHDAHGNERAPLDENAIVGAAERIASSVSAFAVIAEFSVRNPAHEQRIAELVRAATGYPVTTSHMLSARLDGPRRALTAALNARLLGTITRLHEAVEAVLGRAGVSAPVMVVRGDGSLVSAGFAAERPIETVLSGPAASVVGALHLAGIEDGIVVDVGGTTTDIAVIRDRRPMIAAQGASVGGHRTMVEAVDMATIGLGGDSEVRVDSRDPDGPLLLGPSRAVPIGRVAREHPSVVEDLHRQLAAPVGAASHGRFLVATSMHVRSGLDARERGVLERLAAGPLIEAGAAPSALDARAAARLRALGLVRTATFTPTDASLVLGSGPGDLDAEAATLAAEVLARQHVSSRAALAPDGSALARRVIDALVERSAAFALRVALAADGIHIDDRDQLVSATLRHHRGAVDVAISLTDPLVAIGAPAPTYYPVVAGRLRTGHVVPEHAGVANAIGAVVGRVLVRRSCTITQPTRGQFRVHLEDQPTFGSVENARRRAQDLLEPRVLADADHAGADRVELRRDWEATTAVIEGKEVFVEGTLTVEAAGRPRL